MAWQCVSSLQVSRGSHPARQGYSVKCEVMMRKLRPSQPHINFAFASALGKHLSRQARRFKHNGLTEHSNKPIHIPLHIVSIGTLAGHVV
jgi:hypothetical protein